MRKLPRQELLTINYSSRYPLALSFRVLPAVTHANNGGARGLRAFRRHSPLTHRYTGILETSDEKRRLGVDTGGRRRGANCREFTFYCARPRQNADFFTFGSLFVSYLLTLPTLSDTNTCSPGCIVIWIALDLRDIDRYNNWSDCL